jgi:hypothetical protein
VATVTLTLEEYNELYARAHGMNVTRSGKRPTKRAIKASRSGKKDPKMARALKKANAWGRTKSGKMRKGVTQAKIMKKAHALRRKMR